MIRHAGDRMIPINSNITREQWESLDESIAWRKKSARKGDLESSLFLMEEIEHLSGMKEYHRERFTA